MSRSPKLGRTLVVACAAVVACYAVVTVAAQGATANPPKTLSALCKLPYVDGAVVRFRAADGVELVGATAGQGRVGVVIGNGWSDQLNDRICEWVTLVQSKLINALVGSGYRVLLFDYRRQGFSQKASGSWEPDMVAANKELRRLGSRQVVILAKETGALVAYSAMPRIKPAPAGLISYIPHGFPGQTSTIKMTGGPGQVDGKAAVAALTLPLLFIKARSGFWAGAPQVLYQAAQSKDKRLVVVPGNPDEADLFNNPAAAGKIIKNVLAFIGAHTTG